MTRIRFARAVDIFLREDIVAVPPRSAYVSHGNPLTDEVRIFKSIRDNSVLQMKFEVSIQFCSRIPQHVNVESISAFDVLPAEEGFGFVQQKQVSSRVSDDRLVGEDRLAQ